MPAVTNMAQLEALIMSKVNVAVAKTRDNIYETLQLCIANYYNEYIPKPPPIGYDRTYAFKNSPIKLDVKVSGTSVSTEVKIDEGYLGSTYSKGQHPTGLEVAQMAEAGTHGGIGGGFSSFWTDTINLLGGEAGIRNLLIYYLKEQGL